MLAVGLMSGTSLDGVDACLVEIKRGKFIQKDFLCVSYTSELKKQLLHIVENKNVTIQQICSLNVELGKVYLNAVLKLLKKTKINSDDISFVSMHGQTVWHNPDFKDGYESSTLQLGDPSYLAEKLNCKVISGFRYLDMAAGGGGAPLVPFANYILFSSKKENIALQNIGGISNVTFLKKNGTVDDIIAFDNGVGNMLIDAAMRRLFNKEYDNHGSYSKKGQVIYEILDELLSDPYLYLAPPKSTGREKYNEEYLSEIILKAHNLGASDYDIIATLSAYTADLIAISYQKFLPTINKVILSGGGALNDFLVDRLRQKIPAKLEIYEDSDSLEALSFVVLGYYTLQHKASNVPNVTGAKRRVVLGQVTDAKEA